MNKIFNPEKDVLKLVGSYRATDFRQKQDKELISNELQNPFQTKSKIEVKHDIFPSIDPKYFKKNIKTALEKVPVQSSRMKFDFSDLQITSQPSRISNNHVADPLLQNMKKTMDNWTREQRYRDNAGLAGLLGFANKKI